MGRPPRSNRGSIGMASGTRRPSIADRDRNRRIALIRSRHLQREATAPSEPDTDDE